MNKARSFNRLSLPVAAVLAVTSWSLAWSQTTDKGEYVVYPCRYQAAAEIEKMLIELLPKDPAVHLVADTRTNRLLLRGPAEAQQIAKSLMQSVDRPSESPASAKPPETAIVRAYPCPSGQGDQWLQSIRELDANRGKIRATFAPETGQLLVLATPSDHKLIERQLALVANKVKKSDGDLRLLPPPTTSGSSADSQTIDQVLHVRSGNVERLEQRVVALFSGRLKQMRRDNHAVYLLDIAHGGTLEFQFDPQRSIVLARGPGSAVAQFARLVTVFDIPSRPGVKTQALRVERTEPMQLNQAVDAYRGQTKNPVDQNQTKPHSNDQSANERVSPQSTAAAARRAPGQLLVPE